MTLDLTKKRHAMLLKEVEDLMEKYPGRSAWSAYEEVGKNHAISPFTVRDICNSSIEEGEDEKE